MLTKLISHEWKDTFKVPVLLLTITVLLSAASLVYFSVADQATADIDLNVRNFVLYIAYILILSGLSMILTIYFAIRFYKNLYTDEGYLMHTLPVKPWMLIVSKLFHLSKKTVADLEKLAAEAEVERGEDLFVKGGPNRFAKAPALHYLEQNLFRYQ